MKKSAILIILLAFVMAFTACDFTSGVDITLPPLDDNAVHPDSMTNDSGRVDETTSAPDDETTSGGSEESTTGGGEMVTSEETTAHTGTLEGEYGLVKPSVAVDKSYFDDTAFIGDSVSLMLKTYALTGALGKATVFAQGSYGLTNALSQPLNASDSTHPTYQGTRMYAEDAVAACGAKKVYIMLGMNDLVYGVDHAVSSYETFISRIKAKSPDVEIFIQSMTPMRNNSSVASSKLNNDKIKEYNSRLEALCRSKGYYFIDVQSIMWEDDGSQLRSAYCSDGNSMGLHLTQAACRAWVDYLLTHTVKFN